MLTREKNKLERSLGGIRDMQKVPSAIWVVDTNKEHLAVGKARKLNIPVIAILDTNCDPDLVDYPIRATTMRSGRPRCSPGWSRQRPPRACRPARVRPQRRQGRSRRRRAARRVGAGTARRRPPTTASPTAEGAAPGTPEADVQTEPKPPRTPGKVKWRTTPLPTSSDFGS